MTTSAGPEDQASIFRRLAAGYDEAIRWYQPTYQAMLGLSTDLARVAAPGTARCLDFGTGTGTALPLLAALFDEVVAVEPGKAMLDLARARAEREMPATANQISFIEGSVRAAASLTDESFDAVHCSMVLMFVKEDSEKSLVLDFFHRVLRAGGALVITELVTDPDPVAEQATFARWRELMRHRGASDDFVASAERQVHAAMDRRTPTQLCALLERAGFGVIEQPFRSLHTLMLLAKK